MSEGMSILTIVNDVKVTVPSSPRLMTNYILQEQGDWFEDEIHFIRHFIKPGMKVIDIGANYGLYSLSIAKIAGPSGKIWAFEPTPSTAACLKKSIDANNFSNIELIQLGLSDRFGSASFYTSPNSELNSLSKEATAGDNVEEISLVTLDHCLAQYDWQDIDFIKLDAEGEEAKILSQGHKTLSALSPLIMFELKHLSSVNLPLIKQFKDLGYESYRLIPGLNVLVPFDPSKAADPYLLNLFCCKEDKAKELEGKGLLVRQWSDDFAIEDCIANSVLGELPYMKSLSGNNTLNSPSEAYSEVLKLYLMSLTEKRSSTERVACLLTSLDKLRPLFTSGEARTEHLATYARIAFDAGERSFGLDIIYSMIDRFSENMSQGISQPFLPAAVRYDSLDPGKNLNAWLFASALEACIEKYKFSSYYTKNDTLPLFESLTDLGFISDGLLQRQQLIQNCNT